MRCFLLSPLLARFILGVFVVTFCCCCGSFFHFFVGNVCGLRSIPAFHSNPFSDRAFECRAFSSCFLFSLLVLCMCTFVYKFRGRFLLEVRATLTRHHSVYLSVPVSMASILANDYL